MVEVKINASEIKGSGDKMIEKLADFLKDKTGGEVSTESKVITVKGEGPALAKKYIRVTIKKFLHKHELIDTFRVVVDTEEDGALYIKERKTYEED
ncbi:MAG: 60S ribosomal protein L22 [Candidatus Bathyarchaeota archaeon]|nr:60S ribosomal protein L22 [Candidatus Bathyarchaeota archaeon]